MKFHAKKQFGQNFLKDKNIAAKIVAKAELNVGDKVWEIGPGKGILTDQLLAAGADITAFEIDRELSEQLKQRYAQSINLIEGDVLRVKWDQLIQQSENPAQPDITIVANIPYNITSPLLYRITEHREAFRRIVLMIQKEVADRLTADVGTKSYGFLTIKTCFYFDVKKLFKVPPHLFSPAPKVESTVISLSPRKDIPRLDDEKLFWRIVQAGFLSRRKTLRNNLSNLMNRDELEKLALLLAEQQEQRQAKLFDLTTRGEALNEEDYLLLYRLISDIRQ